MLTPAAGKKAMPKAKELTKKSIIPLMIKVHSLSNINQINAIIPPKELINKIGRDTRTASCAKNFFIKISLKISF